MSPNIWGSVMTLREEGCAMDTIPSCREEVS